MSPSRVIRSYLVISGIFTLSASLIWGINTLFLLDAGLTIFQVFVANAVFTAAMALFEIPTGVVADTYSRRLSLIIGCLGTGVAWMAVGVVSAPWLIIALWGVWGLAYTFTSGAEEAWIADEVGADKVGRIFLKGSRVWYVGAVAGLVLQVAIGIYSLRAGVIVGGAVTVIAGLLCLVAMPETGFTRKPREERGSALSELKATAKTGVRYAWAAPVIVLLIGVDFFMGMSSEAFDRLKEAHFLRDVGLPAVGSLEPVVWFGIFWLVGMVLGFFATGWMLKRFERGGLRVVTTMLFALTALEMVAMFAFAFAGATGLAIVALLAVFFARDLAGPLYTIWLNDQIRDSTVRATVLSISGQANAIGQAGGGPVLGAIGNVWGIRAALATGAAVIAPALALYGRAIAHQGREPELEELPAEA